MYLVTDVVDKGKKLRITFNDEIVVRLYKGEAKRFGITLNAVLSEENFVDMYDVLRKRARERALFLLKDMDKSERQIREKLQAGEYPKDIIDNTISFLKKYNYVNDERYAKLYVELKRDKKSVKQIEMDLYNRGIKKDIIHAVLEECEVNNDKILNSVIEKIIHKYDLKDRKQYNKLCRHLLSKGFKYDEIANVLGRYGSEEI